MITKNQVIPKKKEFAHNHYSSTSKTRKGCITMIAASHYRAVYGQQPRQV